MTTATNDTTDAYSCLRCQTREVLITLDGNASFEYVSTYCSECRSDMKLTGQWDDAAQASMRACLLYTSPSPRD